MSRQQQSSLAGWIFSAAILTCLLVAGTAHTAVGDCIEGMYSVYERACEQAERDSGECTTRYESTPEAYWCCCDDEYPLSVCAQFFDSILGKSNNSASNAMTVSRGVRDNLLKKSALGEEYIELYYANVGNATKLLIQHPALAKEAASVFRANIPLLIDLSEGKRVALPEAQKRRALKLLRGVGKAAGADSELGKAVRRVHDDLESGKSLSEFNIQLKD